MKKRYSNLALYAAIVGTAAILTAWLDLILIIYRKI